MEIKYRRQCLKESSFSGETRGRSYVNPQKLMLEMKSLFVFQLTVSYVSFICDLCYIMQGNRLHLLFELHVYMDKNLIKSQISTAFQEWLVRFLN